MCETWMDLLGTKKSKHWCWWLLLNVGNCRAIGVSNYNEKHLSELLSSCEIKPMVNQVPSSHSLQ